MEVPAVLRVFLISDYLFPKTLSYAYTGPPSRDVTRPLMLFLRVPLGMPFTFLEMCRLSRPLPEFRSLGATPISGKTLSE